MLLHKRQNLIGFPAALKMEKLGTHSRCHFILISPHLSCSFELFVIQILLLGLSSTDLNCPTSSACFQCFHPKAAPVFIPTCRDEPSKSYFVKWANLLGPEKARLMFSICVYKVSFRCGEATCHGKRVVRKSEETNW